MNAEIIAVGSELLLGQIANTNAQFLSSQLAELGINVYYHTVVGDNAERLASAVEIVRNRSDLLIFTGGLGPTKDDLTKETIAASLGRKLVMDEEALESIVEYFQKVNRHMSENNKKQALVLEGSTILKNDYGMAPGMGLSIDGTAFMLLPGPPKEMKPMFLKYGRDFLTEHFSLQDRIESRVLRFFGIGESQLETDIEDLIANQTNPTIAPLAGDGEVTLRLTAKHHSPEKVKELLDQAENSIQERVGQFLYGYDETSLAKEVKKELASRNLTLSSAESLTGGLFIEELIRIPGSSSVIKGSVVCYTNEVKANVVKVSQETLDSDGAVSESCARQLAENIRELMGSDIGIGFTGVAGPGTSEGKPVGTVFIGIAIGNKPAEVISLNLAGSRDAIRNRTVKNGYFELLKLLRQ